MESTMKKVRVIIDGKQVEFTGPVFIVGCDAGVMGYENLSVVRHDCTQKFLLEALRCASNAFSASVMDQVIPADVRKYLTQETK